MTTTTSQPAKIPQDMPTQIIVGASLVSIVLSLLMVKRNTHLANFLGLWAPTILGIGILFKENKLLELSRRAPSYS